MQKIGILIYEFLTKRKFIQTDGFGKLTIDLHGKEVEHNFSKFLKDLE